MRKLLFHAVLLYWFLVLPSPALGQIREVIVWVDGLACPFCAYGVEKKLKRVEGVESIDIAMQEGTVTLSARKGLSIDFEEVPGAVKDSGFSLRDMVLRATGRVIVEDGALFFQYGGPGELLALEDIDSALRAKLAEHAGSGKAVMVEGRLTGSPGAWVLKPESVETLAE